MPEEAKDPVRSEVVEGQPRDLAASIHGREAQHEAQRVSVAADGGVPQALLGHQVVGEEGVEERAQRGHGGGSKGRANLPKRRLGSWRKCAVMGGETALGPGVTCSQK